MHHSAHTRISRFLHCKKDPIYVLSEMKLRGLFPNFHIHVSVSDYIFPGPVHLFCCSKKADVSCEYINRSQIHECRDWETRPSSFISGKICFEFSVQCLCSAYPNFSKTELCCASLHAYIYRSIWALLLTCNYQAVSVSTQELYTKLRFE